MEDTSLPKPRPVLVTILAIFTIIGTIGLLLIGLLSLVIPEISIFDSNLPIWIDIGFYLSAAIKFIAAIFLLRMRKIGFYLYAIFEAASALLFIIGGKMSMDYMDTAYVNPSLKFDPRVLWIFLIGSFVGFSIAFIGGYAAHLGKMD